MTSQHDGIPLPYGLWEFECGCNIINRPTPDGIVQIIRCLNHSSHSERGYMRIVNLKPINKITKTEVLSS